MANFNLVSSSKKNDVVTSSTESSSYDDAVSSIVHLRELIAQLQYSVNGLYLEHENLNGRFIAIEKQRNDEPLEKRDVMADDANARTTELIDSLTEKVKNGDKMNEKLRETMTDIDSLAEKARKAVARALAAADRAEAHANKTALNSVKKPTEPKKS